MGSLAGLNILTVLCIEYRMLLGYVTKVTDEKLVEMLPPSIEKVVLKHNIRYYLWFLSCLILKIFLDNT